MSLDIKPCIVEKSCYTRQLETADQLQFLLNQCSKFIAWRKFEEIASKAFWRFNFRDTYGGRIEFYFQPFDDKENDFLLSFDVEARTIPAVAAGLALRSAKISEWKKSENEKECSLYRTEKEIEEQFKNEHTPRQFEARRKALVAGLREYADYLEAFKL